MCLASKTSSQETLTAKRIISSLDFLSVHYPIVFVGHDQVLQKSFFQAQKGEHTTIQGISCEGDLGIPQEIRLDIYKKDLPPPSTTAVHIS